MPEIVGIGGIFIDDVVLPDGSTHMAQLGGAVVHALMGAALWADKPGILGFAGQDLPTNARDTIQTNLDTQGLITLPQSQARAWQIFEHDGSRRELHRVKDMLPFVRGPKPDHMIPAYQDAQGYYLLLDFDSIRAWSEVLQGIILWEPSQLVMTPENSGVFRETLRAVQPDIVSPNLLEAQHIYGTLSPDELIDSMLADGAQIVALRMGEHGSIIADSTRRHIIPAVAIANIVDLTGAGNTYCGGLLAGLIAHKSLHDAALMAAVSASFSLETFGVVQPTPDKYPARDQRLADIR